MTPQEIRAAQDAELERLKQKNGGTVAPDVVVAFAKNPKTALHQEFCWDDTEAAKQYRLIQAHELLRFRYTVIAGPDQKPMRVRAWISLPSERPERGYRPIGDVMRSKQMREEFETELRREMQAAIRRYKIIERVSPLYRQLKGILEPAES